LPEEYWEHQSGQASFCLNESIDEKNQDDAAMNEYADGNSTEGKFKTLKSEMITLQEKKRKLKEVEDAEVKELEA